ncbi:acyl-CoA carboxylase subunit beta [Oceanibacterium hippocampi]|uniref:Methylmalonyl-CoA carboxyltransferase 12S subunit n=1 Tax=Oceanibacterium hippocampi TaxID=745714 RepID=A0A1Y5SV80_9PROT|nr:carboxyl transferase domain-containing protein [Oceanibacterium hippocampi]SLN47324.1 Methylmalonyl-CoA carboxyltransferase 12S subunit [Oceanibacterium hippocampi]
MSAYEKILAEHEKQKAKALGMGGEKKLAARREAGRLNARERIDVIFDEGTFVETGMFVTSHRPEARDRSPADGKVTGFGKIDGRMAGIVSCDLTVLGASSSLNNVKKMGHMRRTAIRNGMPLIFLNETSGARIPDTMGAQGTGALGQDPTQFLRDREIPYVSACLGPSFGTGTWFTMLSDFVVMRKGACLAVSSPRVTSLAIKESVDPEELGGWRLHTEKTGIVDYAVDTDEEALELVRKFLSYLPSHCDELPPEAEPREAGADPEKILEIVPPERQKVYDVRKLIAAIADKDSVFELKPKFGKVATTAFARMNGKVVGFVATNPMFKAGALDPDGCDKIISFLVMCDSFHIPVLILTDTPGFLIGIEGERRKAPGKIMNFMTALQMCTVPKISIVTRKSYGQAYLNMGGSRNSDEMGAWPTADVGFMDPNIGVNVVYGVTAESDPQKFEELKAEITRDSSAYDLAAIYSAQTVLDPRETRDWLLDMLEVHSRGRSRGFSKRRLASWPTTF